MSDGHPNTSGGNRVLGLLWYFYRRIPYRASAIILMQVIGGLLENVGILTMLPAIQMATAKPADGGESELSRQILHAFALVGLEPALPVVLVVVTVAVFIKVGLAVAAGAMNSALVLDMVSNLRTDIIRHLLHVRWPHFVRSRTGRYVNLLGSESERVSPALNQGIGLVVDAIHTLLYLVSAFLVSWPITAMAIALGALKLTVTRPIIRVARQAGARQSAHNATFGAHLVEVIEMAKPIKAMAREDDARRILDNDVHELRQAQWHSQFCSLLLSNIDELMIAVILAICFYLTVVVLQADIAQLAIIGVLMSRTITKIGVLQKRYFTAASNETALSGLLGTLEELKRDPDCGQGDRAPTLTDGIVFRDVRLGYGQKTVLDHVHVEIPARSLTVFMGPSGSGKTTLIDALVALIPVQGGTVTIDGCSIDQLDVAAWRRAIGYVPQETVLLHGSVRDNITLRAPDIADEEITEALRAAEAWDFVQALQHGLDTFVGERGLMLSGGQRQRLAIARALVHRPKLLILDEATSALDSQTERELCSTFRRLAAQVTVVAISHQTAISSVADVIYRVERGVVSHIPTALPAASSDVQDHP